jgi:hypothetical protein
MTNREEWLYNATTALRQHFALAGYTIPDNVRATCGFPSRKGTGNRKALGQCWADTASDGKVFEIFISPVVSDALNVADILAHELAHATAGLDCGHKGKFAKVARAIGLEGKLTATIAGDAFKQWFAAQAFGPYPHEALNANGNAAPKQATRLVKAECPECLAEGAPYIVRASQSTLDRGAPYCPIHNVPMMQA